MAEQTDDNSKRFIEEAVQQFVNAQIEGQKPDIDEFVKKYPPFEHQIRQMIRDVQRVDVLFTTLTRSEESDSNTKGESGNLIGKQVGHFNVTEMIGRGGMGEVYLARDTKLKRSVAIKSMPAALAGDATARMRFRREAELLASLNHPNIAVIYEIIEQKEGAGYLILEYVPGETLAERIAREPLKLEEILSIGQQIAEAVSAAHEKGVIHRDLKPGNIKITPEGRVKVLDFGLAKATHSRQTNQDTVITQPGRVVGTPTYMSPEQARSKDTGHRTDIWSFGCMMYEMLTGKLPFEGETAADTLARIIECEPDWEMLPEETPANIRVLLRRCLEKDPRRRLRDIGDAAIEIHETLNVPTAVPPVIASSSASLESDVASKTRTRRTAVILTATFSIVLSVIALKFIPQKGIQPSSKEIRLVVLPFENLGPVEDEYFADGITDEITARLANIHGLGIISRQSAMQYKKSEKKTKQIADELGVDYILEGTIQREAPSDSNSPVRIRPQLIKASNDMHLWAEAYNGDMSEIFRLQSDVAEQVAQALDITVLEPERRTLASRPTENMEAYDYYLRGNEYFHRSLDESDFRIAVQMYEKAVALDPMFALAHAQLSRAHVYMYFMYHDHIEEREERLAMAKDALDKALELAPDLPELRLALGHYYYHGNLDYDLALEQFAIARKRQPNSSELMTFTGYVQRRQGKFEKAVVTLKEASELDPRSARLTYSLGSTSMLLRKYSDAERYYERAISLAPDWPRPYAYKMQLYFLAEGSTKNARTVLTRALENIGTKEDVFVFFHWVSLEMFDGNYQRALDTLSLGSSEVFETQFYFVPKEQLYGQINGLMGNRQLEQAYYESARGILESIIRKQPEDARFHSSLGIAYAGLGRKQDAIREGKLAVDLLPVTKEAWKGLFRIKDLASIYVMVGEFDAAVDQLEFLLSRPGELSIPLLRLDPVWAPLRNHPRFQRLLKSEK